jgi:hypothetical protein
LLGKDAYAPGTNGSGGPSFIGREPCPLITSRSSLAVCQCHGTRHPDASFNSTHAGPLRGSPRRIAAEAQLGMAGIGSNFSDCGVSTII